MTRLASFKPSYTRMVFHDQFRTTQHISDNGGTISGNPTFGDGIILDGTGDSVDYTVLGDLRAVKTVVMDMTFGTTSEEMVDLDGGTHYLSSSAGTVSATGFSSPTIYVDGSVTSTITAAKHRVVVTTATAFDATALIVGLRGGTYMNGTVHEVALYTEALTAGEVTDDNNGDTFSKIDPSRALIWMPLRTSASDATPNIGSLGGTIPLGDGSTSTTFPTQLYPHGASLDGGDYWEHTTLDASLPQGTAARTVAFLIDMSASTGNDTFIGYGENIATKEFGIRVNVNNVIQVSRHSGTVVISSSFLPFSGIHSVVVTYDGSNLRAYVDGEQTGSTVSDGGNIDTGNGFGFTVGARANGLTEKFTGSMWLPSVWDFELTPIQVRYLHFLMLRDKNV